MSGISKLGQRIGGVRTIDGLKLRCDIDEISGCWMWRGAVQAGQGIVWLPELNATRNIKFAALFLTGRRPKPGKVSYSTCGCGTCCNPEHVQAGTMKQAMTTLAALGKFSTPEKKLAMMRLGKLNRHLSDEQVSEILRSDETGVHLAKQYGVSRSVVSRIRRGQTYRRQEIAGASVFTYREAA